MTPDTPFSHHSDLHPESPDPQRSAAGHAGSSAGADLNEGLNHLTPWRQALEAEAETLECWETIAQQLPEAQAANLLGPYSQAVLEANPELILQLSAYVDDMLSGREREQWEQQLWQQPALAQQLGQWLEVQTALHRFFMAEEARATFTWTPHLLEQLLQAVEASPVSKAVPASEALVAPAKRFTPSNILSLERLSAGLDGELTVQEAEALQQELQQDPALASVAYDWRLLSDASQEAFEALEAQTALPVLSELDLQRYVQAYQQAGSSTALASKSAGSQASAIPAKKRPVWLWGQNAVAVVLGAVLTFGLMQWFPSASMRPFTQDAPGLLASEERQPTIRSAQLASTAGVHSSLSQPVGLPNGLLPVDASKEAAVPYACQFKEAPSSDAYLYGLDQREYRPDETFFLYEL